MEAQVIAMVRHAVERLGGSTSSPIARRRGPMLVAAGAQSSLQQTFVVSVTGGEEHGMDRYTVISADCHAGADLPAYRPYLEARYHDQFDRWLAAYENPFRDLTAPDKS